MTGEPRLGVVMEHDGHSSPDASTPLRALDADGYGVVATGTVLWILAALLGLVAPQWFADRGLPDWVAICLSGAGLGVLGLLIIRRRRRRGVRL